jgi:hypothetical protein
MKLILTSMFSNPHWGGRVIPFLGTPSHPGNVFSISVVGPKRSRVARAMTLLKRQTLHLQVLDSEMQAIHFGTVRNDSLFFSASVQLDDDETESEGNGGSGSETVSNKAGDLKKEPGSKDPKRA